MRSEPLSWRKTIVFSALPTLLLVGLLIGLEIYFRIHESVVGDRRWSEINRLTIQLGRGQAREIFEPSPTRFWRLRKNVSLPERRDHLWWGLISNAYGYRNPPFQLEKSPSAPRILAVGNSTTFGAGVSMESNWCYRLEKKLRQTSPNIQVINAGVPGYTSHQGVVVLREELNALHPDVVIVNFGNNDGWPWGDRTDREQEIIRSGWLERNLATYRWLKGSFFSGATTDKNWAEDVLHSEIETVSSRSAWKPRVPVSEYRENLGTMIELVRQAGARPVLLIWPWQAQIVAGENPRAAYQRVTHQVGATEQVPVIDLVPSFQRSGLGVKLFLDGLHGSDSAQVIAAREIFKYLDL